jgi:TIR domain
MDARPAQTMRDHIFISYSRADSEWLDRLNTCLKPLKRADQIVVWDDSAIKPTDVWRTEIQNGLDRACIAILLVVGIETRV